MKMDKKVIAELEEALKGQKKTSYPRIIKKLEDSRNDVFLSTVGKIIQYEERYLWRGNIIGDLRNKCYQDLQLDENELKIIGNLIENKEITDNYLNAKISEALWAKSTKKNKHKYACIAVEAYIDLAEELWNSSENAKEVIFRNELERCLRIALLMNNQDFKGKIKLYSEEKLNSLNVEENAFSTLWLIKILLDLPNPEHQKYLSLSKAVIAKRSDSNTKEQYTELKIEIAKDMKNIELQKQYKQDFVDLLILKAAENSIVKNYLLASDNIYQAMRFCRANNMKIDNLKGLFEEYNKQTHKNFKTIKSETIIPDDKEQLYSLLDKMELGEIIRGLFSFSLYVEGSIESSTPLMESVTTKVFDKEGKFLGTRFPDIGFKASLDVLVLTRISKMLDYVLENFGYELMSSVALDLIKDNPLVDKSRAKIIFKSLSCGFLKEFMLSTHMIAPQFENILRDRLKAKNAYSLNVNQKNDNRQDDVLLDEMLRKPELETDEFIGKDFIYNFKMILTDKVNGNLRNRALHGLMDDAEFETAENVYLWWLFGKLLFNAKCIALQKEKKAEETGSE